MILDIKFVLFAFIIITIFSEGEQQNWQSTLLFFQNSLINFLFPKNPKLVRVRRKEQMSSGSGAVVLDFVSITKLFLIKLLMYLLN